jgi:hypothetical protein
MDMDVPLLEFGLWSGLKARSGFALAELRFQGLFDDRRREG